MACSSSLLMFKLENVESRNPLECLICDRVSFLCCFALPTEIMASLFICFINEKLQRLLIIIFNALLKFFSVNSSTLCRFLIINSLKKRLLFRSSHRLFVYHVSIITAVSAFRIAKHARYVAVQLMVKCVRIICSHS